MTATNLVDAYTPSEIAHKVQNLGVKKATTDALTLLILGMLAGAFIALGGLFYLIVITKSELGFGITRMLGGISFALGLILVIVGGAELFTGNILIMMAWASKLVSTRLVLRNWLLVYIGNMIGAIVTALLVYWAKLDGLADGAVRETMLNIALHKAELSLEVAFVRGILCNGLVCLGVWLAMGGRTVTDKILAIIFPISAFVAIGSEHSIANWFFLPLAALINGQFSSGMAQNLLFVTLGNMVGGGVLVAGIYWLAYLRSATE